jgi:hypothetical protein
MASQYSDIRHFPKSGLSQHDHFILCFLESTLQSDVLLRLKCRSELLHSNPFCIL